MLKNQAAFTLLEMMIAVSITALIGISSTNLLSNIINTKKATDDRSEQLTTLQRFNQVVSRDAEQLINRSIRDEYGDTQPALIVEGTHYLAEWSRLGWRNSPINENPRSTIQRVAFQTFDIDEEECKQAKERLENWGNPSPDGLCLVRYFWPVLDRSGDSEPTTQIILDLIESIEIELLVENESMVGGAASGENNTASNNTSTEASAPSETTWHSQWPEVQVGDTAGIPIAMRWKITLPKIGEIERLWLFAYDDQ